MDAPAGPRRPSPWLAALAVGAILGVAALVGLSGGQSGGDADVEEPDVPLAEPEVTTPTLAVESPTRAGIEALGGALAVVEGAEVSRSLRLVTAGGPEVEHPMPVSFDGVSFDAGRTAYAFLDGHLRLHLREADAPAGLVSLAQPLAFNVASWSWSSTEPRLLAAVTFDVDGFRLWEGFDDLEPVTRVGAERVVGFDGAGYLLHEMGNPADGTRTLRRIDRGGTELGSIDADVVHVGASGVIVVARERAERVDGRRAFDWFLVDRLLERAVPIPGPPYPSEVAVVTGTEPTVAFFVDAAGRDRVDIYFHERRLTRTFELDGVEVHDLHWSDGDERLVITGVTSDGTTDVVQLLEVETGITTTLGYDEP
ncbi:MAG: hypothetical protein R3290_10960, partial [Acidimicrobiia bacterium]|nr:hypothetical protein [Acidimicrobiia bacterium]